MKRYTILLLSLLLATQFVSAQQKVVESSADKAPAWVGISVDNFIIVSAEHSTLDGAKSACLTTIQQSIINSVAVNITSSEQSYDAMMNNGYGESITHSYESRVETIAARLPFIQGITLDKAEIYWKKLYDKSDKTYKYEVHAKYPFSSMERRALVDQYNAIEKEKSDKFQEIKDAFSTFTEVEYITRAMNDLKALYEYFMDQNRKADVKALMENYRKCYSAISIVPQHTDLGEIVFYLNLEGRRMVTSRRPNIKSEYATQIECSPIEDNLYRITYNYDNCLPEDDNKIDISYHFANNAVARHTFYFDVAKDIIEVVPFGQVELDVKLVNAATIKDGDTIESKEIAKIEGWLDLRAKQDTPFKVTSINISFDGLNFRVKPELNEAFEGKGTHRLGFEVESSSDAIKRRNGVAKGIVTIVNAKTNKSSEVRFNLPYKIIL